MAWPSPVSAGISRVLASQYDDLLAGVQAWPAPVSAGGYALSDLGGASLHTTNATWPEFQLRPVAGAGVSTDAIVFQFNARATAGAADAWGDVWKVAQVDGALTFGTAVTFLGSVSGLPLASTLTAGIVSASDYATFLASSAAGTSWTVDVKANAQNLFFNTSNAAWNEFALGSLTGATAADDTVQLKYNARASSGGIDAWFAAISIKAQSGAITISPPVTFSSALILNGSVNTNSQLFLGNPSFNGAVSINTLSTNGLNVNGSSALNGALTLNGSVACNGQTFTGAATFSGLVGFTGSPYCAPGLFFANAVGASQFQLYAGAGTYLGLNYWTGSNYAQAWQVAITTGAMAIQTGLTINGSLTIAGATNISIGSNWTGWTPGMSTGASYSSYAVIDAAYFRIGAQIHFKVGVSITFTGTTNYVALSLPFAAQGPPQVHASMIGPNGVSYSAGACYTQGGGSATLLCYLPGWPNFSLGNYSFYISGCYQA